MAAFLICAAAHAMTDYNVGYSSDVSTSSININGFTFTPSIQGNGTGTFEISEQVQLNYIDILFHNGSGVKDAVTSVNRSVALFTGFNTVAPENVVAQAVGNVVLPWSNAIAVGSSGAHTWIRFDFSGSNLILDQDTQYALAFIGPNGYAFGDDTNWDRTGVRVTSNVPYTGGAVINGTPAENLTYDPIFTANFTPVPEPATALLLGLGALAMTRRRKRERQAQGTTVPKTMK